jgi:asparagine synthase (glutamine-hydrolysing)
MCGLLFQVDARGIQTRSGFLIGLRKMRWRGPDAEGLTEEDGGRVRLGHCRLSIIDPTARSNQPMASACGQFVIIFNGEIYNHLEIRRALSLQCRTTSDTETIIEGFAKRGREIFALLDGMFALVIYDRVNKSWISARDAFGIKPLFIHQDGPNTVIASESAVIAAMVSAPICRDSIDEWRLIRRPIPGASYFQGVREVPPGVSLDSRGWTVSHWEWPPEPTEFSQVVFEQLVTKSVRAHELSDVTNVALLSGGLDSAVITALSKASRCYSVGLNINNEFEGARETAQQLNQELVEVELTVDELVESWKELAVLRGEPLSVPNEGLIFRVSTAMQPEEKVVLTGEGADELLFGYDRIFRWSTHQIQLDITKFLRRYGYSETAPTPRLVQFLAELAPGKRPVEFVEDFFYRVHLPGLLRRMDFASMAASKEARVPFVDKSLISYMYRQPVSIKMTEDVAKLPLRRLAQRMCLKGALGRRKIGFSAHIAPNESQFLGYQRFQAVVLEALKW